MIDWKWVVLLANGQRIKVNICDVNPALHGEDDASEESAQEAASDEATAPQGASESAEAPEPGEGDERPGASIPSIYDVNAQEAAVMIDLAETREQLEALYIEETAGKARVTVVRRIQHRLEVLGG